MGPKLNGAPPVITDYDMSLEGISAFKKDQAAYGDQSTMNAYYNSLLQAYVGAA